MVRKLFMTVVALLLVSAVSFAQSGKITGKVIDRETGDPLPGANVVIVGTTLGAATNVSGEFVILSVPTGEYSVKAAFIGYREVTVDQIRVSSGLTTQLNFELPSEALEVSEISIVAERPLVNKNATNAVRIQGYEDLKNLPVRGVGAAVALQPGIVTVNNDIYIRGGRKNDTGFYLEGANVRDRLGDEGAATGGDNPVQVIPEALEEFQVQAGGYTAEFGGANAGIVRQTLKTGGQDYGFTFQFETDDFASEGKQFLDTYSYGYQDFTATFNGPVPGTENKLRFFVAGQRRNLDDRVQRFQKGFNFQHADEADFANNRFPIILSTNRGTIAEGETYSEFEKDLQAQGITMPDGNIPWADRNETIGNGTLVYDAKPFIFRLSGSMSRLEQTAWPTSYLSHMIFNTDRLGETEVSTGLVSFKVTHLLGTNSFYEVNLNYFDRRQFTSDPVFGDNIMAFWDSTANAAEDIQFTSLNNPWLGGNQTMDIYGFDFYAPGTPMSSVVKEKRNYWGGSFNFTTQLPEHEVKFGASLEAWTLRNFGISRLGARSMLIGARQNPDLYRDAVAGDLNAQRRLSSLATAGTHYGYDVFGNEIGDEHGDVDGPRNPMFFSAYLQDKFEAEDIVINAGIRLDYIDNDDFEFADPENPAVDLNDLGLNEDALIDVDPTIELSPRLGIAFPVTDRTVFHLQYGRFVQAPRLTDIYQGSTWFNDVISVGGFSYQSNLVGYALNPEITTQYEMGFNQQFTDNAAFDITAYYKSIKDQIQLSRVNIDPTSGISNSAYNVLVNGDFATTAGIELSLTLRRTARLAGQVNYTFSRALGTGSQPASAISAIENEEPVPTVISPLDFNRSHVGSINLDYRFGKGDGGPILEQLGANLLMTFQSGHPYTLVSGGLGQQDAHVGGVIGDPRARNPLGAINSFVTPSNWQINLRIDKTVNFNKFSTNFYVYVENLTNRRNVINVYQRTGNAWDDGFLNDPTLSASVVAAQEGLAQSNGMAAGVGSGAYEALYRALNLSGNGFNYRQYAQQDADANTITAELFGVPRQIRVGARIEL